MTSTTVTEPRHFYHPELDSLRFLAFSMVFFHHALSGSASLFRRVGFSRTAAMVAAGLVDAGRTGVDLFFVLSSYLITSILLRERNLRGDFRLTAFYARRALRIWPLYFVTIAFCTLVLRHVLPGEHIQAKYVAAFAVFGGNWAMIAWGLPASGAGVLWSVSIEEQFYILWPLALRRLHGVRVAVAGIVFTAVAIAARYTISITATTSASYWYNTFARLDTIGAGILIAYFYAYGAPALGGAYRIALGALSTAAIVVSAMARLPEQFTLSVDTLSCAGLLLSVLHPNGACPAILRNRTILYLGRISYGLYALHQIAINAVSLVGHPHGAAQSVLKIVAMFVVTLGAAAVSYRFIESPFLKLKERLAVVTRDA